MRKVAKAACWTALGGAFVTAWHLRPRPEPHYPQKNVPPKDHLPALLPHLRHDESEPLLLTLARLVVIPTVVGVSRIYGKVFNTFEAEGVDELHKYIHEREPGQALITVCNHTSVVDEPILFSCILKPKTIFRPHTMRWGACAQEICFANDFLSFFFGCGKVLPVRRGNGVMQHSWTLFATQVKKGQWVHVFPEAGVFQTGKLHRLKWGVGRLVSFADADSPPPLIVPFYHLGMESTMPQDTVTNELTTSFPSIGNRIRLKVGKPIPVQDLLEEYRKRKAKEPPLTDAFAMSDADKWLWAEVTTRVQNALVELENEMIARYGLSPFFHTSA